MLQVNELDMTQTDLARDYVSGCKVSVWSISVNSTLKRAYKQTQKIRQFVFMHLYLSVFGKCLSK